MGYPIRRRENGGKEAENHPWGSNDDDVHRLPPQVGGGVNSEATSVLSSPPGRPTSGPQTATARSSDSPSLGTSDLDSASIQTLSITTSRDGNKFLYAATPSVSGEPSFSRDDDDDDKIMPAATGVGSVIVLVIIGFTIFFCLRKRKRQRQQQVSQAQMQQMKNSQQPLGQARVGTEMTYPQYATPPNHSHPPTVATPQPVILGPIVPGSNGAYYTGIDTSDVVSVHDRAGLENPFADGDNVIEEPPPPYRPRSLAPMSRNTSLRVPATMTSRTSLIGGHGYSVRSPFADSLDDDTISDISGPTLRGSHNRMSVVSDMSYQEDPIVSRPSV